MAPDLRQPYVVPLKLLPYIIATELHYSIAIFTAAIIDILILKPSNKIILRILILHQSLLLDFQLNKPNMQHIQLTSNFFFLLLVEGNSHFIRVFLEF